MARQVDLVLRQVIAANLRFVLVVRTPPQPELAAYPLLAACVYQPGSAGDGSYRLAPWDHGQAQRVWDDHCTASDPAFANLPLPIQRLAQVPIYMALMRTAGHEHGLANATPLVDRCVRSILRSEAGCVEPALQQLADLALQEAPTLVPAPLRAGANLPPGDQPAPTQLSLVLQSSGGRPTIGHDVLREYLLATHIADTLAGQGRSTATVNAVNDLAAAASASAAARGVFEFVIDRLDSLNPQLLEAIALSPAARVTTTLPLMLAIAASGARFATTHVLRTCAQRCGHENAAELARALLAMPTIATTLREEHAPWAAGLLHQFGPAVWPPPAQSIEQSLDAHAAARLLAHADLDQPEQATFYARHVFLFADDTPEWAAAVDRLVGHPDWRVRAALAEVHRDHRTLGAPVSESIMDKLVRDADYKVRAAAATTLTASASGDAARHIGTLLRDRNWRVRERVLHGIVSASPSPRITALAGAAIDVIATDASWRHCPAHVATAAQRTMLLYGPATADDSPPRQRALYGILRELRTRATTVSPAVLDVLLQHATVCSHWLVRREAAALQHSHRDHRQPASLPSHR